MIINIILLIVNLFALAATVVLFFNNRRFINKHVIKLNPSYRAEAKRIDGKTVCYQLFDNNILQDYIEGCESNIFRSYVTGMENCYVFSRFSRNVRVFKRNEVPQELAQKFRNLHK